MPPAEGPWLPTVEARLVALREERATGALTVRDGQRIRTFFLRDGRLVQTASNLKKEGAMAVAGRMPAPSRHALPQEQAGARLAGALAAVAPRVTWEEGRAPGREQPVDLLQALFEGLARGLDDATTAQRLLTLGGTGDPRAVSETVPTEEDLPVPLELRAWIQTLDGRRPLSEALEFGPPDVAIGLRTLYLATLLGLVAFPRPSSGEVRAERVPDGATESRDEVDERLARLIASGISRATQPPAMDPAEAAIRSEIHRIEQAETHHEVLGLAWDSTEDDFQKAYFSIARILHPDRMTASDADLVARASTAFDRAREAWECFRDEPCRQAYLDRVVHGRKSEDELATERVQEILSMEALFRRGMTFFHAGQVVKAFPCFEEAARKVPEQAEFRVYLGYTLWKLKRRQDPTEAARGRRMLEDALPRWGRDDGFVLLGRVCREEGDEDAASEAWTRALKVNPQNREALREMERIRHGRASSPEAHPLRRLLSRLVRPGDG
ncbi:MAG: DnaJ domain-containing protein [Deltaproteobacteria bacterium]|nr:DnaJ domain-containing protein [Deltaproteobacteria bacterium]